MTTLERSLLIKGLSGPIHTIPLVEGNLIRAGYFERTSGGLVITVAGVAEANIALTEFEEADSVAELSRWRVLFEVTQPMHQKPAIVFREAMLRAEVTRASALVAAYSVMRSRYPDAALATIEVLNIELPINSLYE